jgi:GNAT superfamily N-acetyltransferase
MPSPDSGIEFREFAPGDEAAFRRLNEEWILRYFTLEPKDEVSFADPRQTILDRGGRIFFAVRDGVMVGCCALLAIAPGEFEVGKMAVTESCQGHGIGRRLLEWTIAQARALGATRLYLETNRVLAPAVRLYESLGFAHIPAERIAPSPYARSNVAMELYLSAAIGPRPSRLPDSIDSADGVPR